MKYLILLVMFFSVSAYAGDFITTTYVEKSQSDSADSAEPYPLGMIISYGSDNLRLDFSVARPGIAVKVGNMYKGINLYTGMGTLLLNQKGSVTVEGVATKGRGSGFVSAVFMEGSYKHFFVRLSRETGNVLLSSFRQTGVYPNGDPIYKKGSRNSIVGATILWIGFNLPLNN